MRIGKIANGADVEWANNSKIENFLSQMLVFQVEKVIETC